MHIFLLRYVFILPFKPSVKLTGVEIVVILISDILAVDTKECGCQDLARTAGRLRGDVGLGGFSETQTWGKFMCGTTTSRDCEKCIH